MRLWQKRSKTKETTYLKNWRISEKMINDLLSAIVNFFISIDSRFGANIVDFVNPYTVPEKGVVITESSMISLIKISAYSLFLILPLSLMKIYSSESNFVNLLFAIILIAFTSSTFAVFLGFFQLLFI
jgi:hypothetical protein